jgi:hypothetical protein
MGFATALVLVCCGGRTVQSEKPGDGAQPAPSQTVVAGSGDDNASMNGDEGSLGYSGAGDGSVSGGEPSFRYLVLATQPEDKDLCWREEMPDDMSRCTDAISVTAGGALGYVYPILSVKLTYQLSDDDMSLLFQLAGDNAILSELASPDPVQPDKDGSVPCWAAGSCADCGARSLAPLIVSRSRDTLYKVGGGWCMDRADPIGELVNTLWRLMSKYACPEGAYWAPRGFGTGGLSHANCLSP